MATDGDVKLRAARGYAELGMIDAARRELEGWGAPADRHLDPEALQTEIFLLIREENWQLGFDCSERLRQLDSGVLSGYVHGAFCLHELGRTDEAHEWLRSGPSFLKKEAVYHYNLACYRAVLGREKAARKALARAITLDPGFQRSAKTDPDLKTLWHD